MSNGAASDPQDEVVARLKDEVAALRRSRRRLAEVAHSERRAIERALHDGVQQHLVALAVDLQRLADLVDRDPNATGILLAEMRANIRVALDEATRLSTNIYPPILGDRGLAAALRYAAVQAGVSALVEVPAVADYSPEVTATLYWTWVGAISSAPRGSQAMIKVLEADGGLAFALTIGGHSAEGYLEPLRDRIEALDGRLIVDDGQDGEALLQGWLPLRP